MNYNYPNGKKPQQKSINRANLGMTLESDIEVTNQYYLEKNIAVIYKKPTPVQVVSVSYPARNKGQKSQRRIIKHLQPPILTVFTADFILILMQRNQI